MPEHKSICRQVTAEGASTHELPFEGLDVDTAHTGYQYGQKGLQHPVIGFSMISQTAEYAVRAVVFVARQGGKASTGREIADATGIPSGYLSKVMQILSRAQVVHSRPGRNGGFTLVKDQSELTFLEIVNAIDPLERIESCPLGRDFHEHALCRLHSHVNDSVEIAEESYAAITVAELLEMADRGKSVCDFPCASPQHDEREATD